MSEHAEHADVDALSAFVDGEAPEWAPHLERCPSCRASVEQLRAVAAAVGAPVDPAAPRSREAALAAALGDVDARHAAERARFARRRSDWRWALPAVAALIAGVLAFSTLVALDRGSSDRTTLAGPAMEPAPTAGPLAEAKSDSSAAATALPPTDLGDVPDAATLLARARPAVAATPGGARASSSANSGSTASGAAPTPTPTPTVQASPLPAAPRVVGTRPCEEQARAREPSLREVVYFATARQGQQPAVVLGFATGPSPSPVTLVLLAQNGCAELLRAAAP